MLDLIPRDRFDVTGDVLEDEDVYLTGPKIQKQYGSIPST